VSLSIQDDGIGFDPEGATTRGLGLIGIQERVRELEGQLTITSQHEKGTMVAVKVPVTRGVLA
jgi:signal transduction histidine kinase